MEMPLIEFLNDASEASEELEEENRQIKAQNKKMRKSKGRGRR